MYYPCDQEYIETEGLGMLLCKDYGLVLFHLENVWISNTMLDPTKTKSVQFLQKCVVLF